MKILTSVVLSLLAAAALAGNVPASTGSGALTTFIRTETYPRPPYSGATYYIYERGGKVICTKLKVCNKYDECETSYRQGQYKDREDIETGDPYDTTAPVPIQGEKLKKHVCLVRFHLVPD